MTSDHARTGGSVPHERPAWQGASQRGHVTDADVLHPICRYVEERLGGVPRLDDETLATFLLILRETAARPSAGPGRIAAAA